MTTVPIEPRPHSPMAPAPAALPPDAVKVSGLSKVYRPRGGGTVSPALIDVDLAIPRGSLFGLLGPNGAGKSTLINILAGLVIKSAGSATIWGYDIDRNARQARAAIGVVPQELNIDPFFTPRELLDLQAGLYGVPRAERRTMEILSALGLADKAEAYARTLSGGMRRRLLIAKALVHNPPVLVLDEPTAGVDIELRQQLWDYVRRLNAAGTTVLLTTHYLEEAEELCDRIAIINHGRLIACDTKEALLKQLDLKTLTLILGRDLSAAPAPIAGAEIEVLGPRRIVVRYRMNQTRISDILSAIQTLGLEIVDLTTEQADLEDIFLKLTRAAGEAPARRIGS